MNTFLFIMLVIAMAAVAYVLVRGVIAMAQGKDVTGEVQQGYMQKRVLYQGIAIMIVILILLLASGGRGWNLVRLNKIYTRTGDGGSAVLVDGSRISKSSARMVAIGEVDEANCAIGVAIAALEQGELADRLRRIQNELFDLGADLATPFGTEFETRALRIVARQVTRLEEEIDAMNASLEPLTSFILPGGSTAVALLHQARCVVRRAERAAVALHETAAVNADALAYLNRLSDHLFVSARFLASAQGGDVLWQPGATRDS